jgi:hypothetical protein
MVSAPRYLKDINILLCISRQDDPQHKHIGTALKTMNQADFLRCAGILAAHPRQIQPSPR